MIGDTKKAKRVTKHSAFIYKRCVTLLNGMSFFKLLHLTCLSGFQGSYLSL